MAVYNVSECQTTTIAFYTVDVNIACTGANPTVTESLTINPTGPASTCFSVQSTTCGSVACNAACSYVLQMTSCTGNVDYEDLGDDFAYSVRLTVEVTRGPDEGVGLHVVSVPVEDCSMNSLSY